MAHAMKADRYTPGNKIAAPSGQAPTAGPSIRTKRKAATGPSLIDGAVKQAAPLCLAALLVSSYEALTQAPSVEGALIIAAGGLATAKTYLVLKDWGKKSGLLKKFADVAGATFKRRAATSLLVGALVLGLTGITTQAVQTYNENNDPARAGLTNLMVGMLAAGHVTLGQDVRFTKGLTNEPVYCSDLQVVKIDKRTQFTCKANTPDGGTRLVRSDTFPTSTLQFSANAITVPNRDYYLTLAFPNAGPAKDSNQLAMEKGGMSSQTKAIQRAYRNQFDKTHAETPVERAKKKFNTMVEKFRKTFGLT